MYLFIITIGLCFSYLFLHQILAMFFSGSNLKFGKETIFSIILIGFSSLLGYFLISNISNVDIWNRLLHAFGGGFLAFMVCFLVVKNNDFKINKWQFFILSTLIVTALGVANEILEFILQYYFNIISAESINDTWLDLISNSVGIAIAGIIFTPFVHIKKEIK
jgi:hypothetical protein